MGDPKKPKKKYISPRHPWQKERIKTELELIGKYGLRNKKELWRHRTTIGKFRSQARSLLGMTGETREMIEKELLRKLTQLGMLGEGATLDDVLDLSVVSILKRRLQTVVFQQGFAKSIYHARQLITHGHITVSGRKQSSPSFLVLEGQTDEIDYTPFSPYRDETHKERPDYAPSSRVETEGE